MTRWIVAGVLLAVLIALIVVDTSSMEASVPSGAPAIGGGMGAAPESATPSDPNVQTAPELPQVVESRPTLDAACAKVKEEIQASKGEDYLKTLGERILTVATEEQLAARCGEVEALPVDQKIARLEALAGGAAATQP